jgi:phosphoribosylformylglycinamidine synthase
VVHTAKVRLRYTDNGGLQRCWAAGLVSAVHDVSDGGIAVALAEMALASGIGAEVQQHPDYTPAAWWFGEDQGRYLVTVRDDTAFQAQLAKGTRNADTAASGVRRIGNTGGQSLFGVPLTELRKANERFFRQWMDS